MEHSNPTEDRPDVMILLQNGGTQSDGEHLDAKGQGACQKFEKKNIIIFLFIMGLVSGNIIQAVQIKKLQATPCSSDGSFHGWSRHGDWYYFFSDKQQNWDFSHSNCSSHGASLVTLDSKEEWALIKSKKEEYWIGLQREKEDQLWKWSDGSNVTQFEVKNTGLCAYTNGETVSSTNCDNNRHWVCRKPVHAA